ncbi:unnamed protein product [Clonostachys rosea]|uniref:Transcriptional regulator n=1 Tax=Bionectria ochroleuca TaxID=29856 RepID=A0ABY6U1L1_BIOOC|nr:unnamed protein product [Clonostachys rosea]
MYIPAVHSEEDTKVLQQFIKETTLGLLTTAIPSETFSTIQSSHIPFVLDAPEDAGSTQLGTLRGHIARQNPQAKAMITSASPESSKGPALSLEDEVLVVFTSPANHYVTPKYYVETKPTTAKVVPTWNYSAVQVYGKAKIYFDTTSEETSAFLQQQISDLSEHTETSIMGYGSPDKPGPWKVTDAPGRYIDIMKKAIMGIEITIERLEGKHKMSQEMKKGDRDGVVRGFENMGTELGREISTLVKTKSELKEGSSS